MTETRSHPLPPGRIGRGRAALDRPIAVLAAVAVVWGVWTLSIIRRGEVGELPRTGITFLDQGAGASATIDALRADAVGESGYDGQFFYYMALDPASAAEYVDAPGYRFGRIGYPALARGLAAAQPGAIPWTLLLVNVLAVGAGTFLLARFLRDRGVSPWFAILFGTAPGLFVAVSRDLSEPLAYALAIAGIAAARGGRPRIVLAGALWTRRRDPRDHSALPGRNCDMCGTRPERRRDEASTRSAIWGKAARALRSAVRRLTRRVARARRWWEQP